MMTSFVQRPTAYVIDDDDAVRDSIRLLLECEGLTVYAFASCAALLVEAHPQGNSCVVVDMHISGMEGFEFLDRLRREGIIIPAIVMTRQLDARIIGAADRAGAILLEKPFRAGELLDCIERALGNAH
jgi:two-component system response regulator FixJ